MIGNDDTGPRWSIGELARASGVTVRTLHHYDEIGLVRPSERTGAGHRRYTEGDLHRLYRVRALRGLGMSLAEIKAAIAGSAETLGTMRDLLGAQLGELRRQAERLQQLTQQIDGLLRQLDESSMPDQDQFMTTLEMISVLDGYFTREQQEQLARRRSELGPEAVEAARTEWVALVGELLPLVRAGAAPDDPRAQDLVRRWDALGARFHPGDAQAEGEQTKEAARRMWRDHRAELSQRLPWPADQLAEMVAYLERVRQAA